MNVAQFFKRVEKLTIDNSPAILTVFGVTGVVATAYLTGKATVKAVEIVRTQNEIPGFPPLERKEAFKLTWKLYIPAAATGTFTICAIIASAHVSSRRATAMAAAYSLSERAFTEYKEKVVEKLGEKKEQAVRDEIAQDRVDRNPPDDKIVIVGTNEVLCYDQFSGRYFRSTMETIKAAENLINFRILHDGYASLSDLYYEIGLKPNAVSGEVGWNMDRNLEVTYSAVLSPENQPCIAIDFNLSPFRNFDKFA